MSLRRFLPDLILVSMALATCAWALASASGWRRIAILAAQMLLGAGLCVTLLQASAQETGYRLLMISGLAAEIVLIDVNERKAEGEAMEDGGTAEMLAAAMGGGGVDYAAAVDAAMAAELVA